MMKSFKKSLEELIETKKKLNQIISELNRYGVCVCDSDSIQVLDLRPFLKVFDKTAVIDKPFLDEEDFNYVTYINGVKIFQHEKEEV